MRILIWGTYRQNYSRNQLITDGLRSAGVQIIECHENLWLGDEDREKIARGNWIFPSFWFRLIKSYYRLLIRIFKEKNFDIIYIAYPGQFDIYFAKLLSKFFHKPVVWDVLNSFYLIMCERRINRNIIEKFSLLIVKQLEKKAFQLPDLLFLDNQCFINWISETFSISGKKFRIIPISADNRFFYPQKTEIKNIEKFEVLYYGTYLPNHGVNLILQAAEKLAKFPNMHFFFVGDGPERIRSELFVAENNITNITFVGWLTKDELLKKIWQSQIILGVFGDTLQVSLTNNNKIIESFASRKPVISSYTNSLPNEIKHGYNIHLCKGGDSKEIVESIEFLYKNPEYCKQLSENAYATYTDYFDNHLIGIKTREYLESLI